MTLSMVMVWVAGIAITAVVYWAYPGLDANTADVTSERMPTAWVGDEKSDTESGQSGSSAVSADDVAESESMRAEPSPPIPAPSAPMQTQSNPDEPLANQDAHPMPRLISPPTRPNPVPNPAAVPPVKAPIAPQAAPKPAPQPDSPPPQSVPKLAPKPVPPSRPHNPGEDRPLEPPSW